MNKYTVSLSDRTRRRTVVAQSSSEAVRAVVGQRLINCRQDSCSHDGKHMTYSVAVQTGRTVNGATPFKNIWAYVDCVPTIQRE